MHFVKGKRTYAFLVLGTIAAVLTLTSAQGEVTTPAVPAATKKQCVQCTSKDNADCLDPTKLQASPCSDDTYTKCFTKNDGGVITRGCLKDGDTATCPSDKCKSCEASDASACNTHNICKKCLATDAKCSQTDVSGITYNDICDAASTKCIVKVTDKKVERHCAASEESCGDDTTTCNACSTANCNAGIFPTKRIRCYQCSDSACSDVSSNSELSTPCLNYVDSDACYMTAESATSVLRGCKSDENSKCSAGTETGCLNCTTDNCNRSPYEKNQELKCIQCTGADCSKEQDVANAKDCNKKIVYNTTEACYTLVKNGSIQRGCLHDDAATAEECGKEGSSCTTCSSGAGCNKDADEFTCVVCRSDLLENCWNNADKAPTDKCRTGNSSVEEGCFHGIWHGVAIRGCFIDGDAQMQVICADDSNHQCRRCKSKNCNTEKSSSGAQSVTLYFGLLAMMTSAIWYLN